MPVNPSEQAPEMLALELTRNIVISREGSKRDGGESGHPARKDMPRLVAKSHRADAEIR